MSKPALRVLWISIFIFIHTSMGTSADSTKISTFGELLKSPFFVDKTLFIKKFLELNPQYKIFLITLPPFWGKSLNLDMVNSFLQLEIDYVGTPIPHEKRKSTQCFANDRLKISKEIINFPHGRPSSATDLIGTFPTIFVSFHEVTGETIAEILDQVKLAISKAFAQHTYLHKALGKAYHAAANDAPLRMIADDELRNFERLCFKNGTLATSVDLRNSLGFLSELLYKYHKKKVFIFIDDYDKHVSNRMFNPQYRNITLPLVSHSVHVLQGIIVTALKQNPYLERSLITGTLGLTPQKSELHPIFEFIHFPCTSEEIAEYYGFTETEVKQLLDKYNLKEKEEEVRTWYQGFRVGQHILFNPWSVTQYLQHKVASEYWIKTGVNLKPLVNLCFDAINERMTSLVENKPVAVNIKETDDPYDLQQVRKMIDKVYNDGFMNSTIFEERVFSYLLHTGHLTCASYSPEIPTQCTGVKIPNRELQLFFEDVSKAYVKTA